MVAVGVGVDDSTPQAHNIMPSVTLQIWNLVMVTSRLL
jgi:hypothetical protein